VPAVKRVILALAFKTASMDKDLRALNQTATESEHMMTGQHIGNALWGLKRMRGNNVQVRAALEALSYKISESTAAMSGQNIGNAFFGLQVREGRKSRRGDWGGFITCLVISCFS